MKLGISQIAKVECVAKRFNPLSFLTMRHRSESITANIKGAAVRYQLLSLLVCCGVAAAQTTSTPVYLDPSKPQEQRIADLISQLTLEEKAEQLNHLNTGIPRLNVPMWGGWNQALHGVWSKGPTTLFPAPIAMGAT